MNALIICEITTRYSYFGFVCKGFPIWSIFRCLLIEDKIPSKLVVFFLALPRGCLILPGTLLGPSLIALGSSKKSKSDFFFSTLVRDKANVVEKLDDHIVKVSFILGFFTLNFPIDITSLRFFSSGTDPIEYCDPRLLGAIALIQLSYWNRVWYPFLALHRYKIKIRNI